MAKLVQKLVGFDPDHYAALVEICDRSNVTMNSYIRGIVAEHLAPTDQLHNEVMTELADLRDLTKEAVDLSAAAVAAVLVFNDDPRLSSEESTEKSVKMLVNALKLIPSVRRHRNDL